MVQNQSNIVLIGMPGSGKSTVGIILAKMISRNFVDTDVIIQISQGRSLHKGQGDAHENMRVALRVAGRSLIY